jgi:hypothetical protein
MYMRICIYARQLTPLIGVIVSVIISVI